jgi:hypothetical protein
MFESISFNLECILFRRKSIFIGVTLTDYFVGHVHTVLHETVSIGVLQVWEEKSAVPNELPELLGGGKMGKPEAHPPTATAQPMARHRHPADKRATIYVFAYDECDEYNKYNEGQSPPMNANTVRRSRTTTYQWPSRCLEESQGLITPLYPQSGSNAPLCRGNRARTISRCTAEGKESWTKSTDRQGSLGKTRIGRCEHD